MGTRILFKVVLTVSVRVHVRVFKDIDSVREKLRKMIRVRRVIVCERRCQKNTTIRLVLVMSVLAYTNFKLPFLV